MTELGKVHMKQTVTFLDKVHVCWTSKKLL